MTAIQDSQTSVSPEPKTTEGIVIGLDFGEWAGFTSGKIMLKMEGEKRADFHYGQHAQGVIPKIGDLVSIEYVGSKIFEVISLEVLDTNRVTVSERVAVQISGLNLLFGHPKAAVIVVLAEVLAGIWIILMGLRLESSKPTGTLILGIVGFIQIFIGWLIWENTGKG